MKYKLSELVKLPKKKYESPYDSEINKSIKNACNQAIDELANLIVEVDEGKIIDLLEKYDRETLYDVKSDYDRANLIAKQLPNIMKGGQCAC